MAEHHETGARRRIEARPPANPWLPRWAAGEFGPLAILLVAAGALLAFALLASEVMEGETHAFDEAVMLFFRNPADTTDPVGPPWFEIMMADITGLGSTTVLTFITLAVIGYLVMDGKHGSAVLVAVAVAGGTALSVVLKIGFDRPRPDLVAHLVDVRTLSFPSGHAMLSTVTYLTLGALLARTQPKRRIKAYLLSLAVLLAVSIGISRIYLGVHWPTDVIAGWCIGAAWALLCWGVALQLQRHGDVEPEGEAPAPP